MDEPHSFTSRDEVIKSFGRFLHYTCRCNRESIERRGMQPAFISPDMTADEQEPDVLRYCTPDHKEATLRMVRAKYWVACECNPKLIEIHVPASAIASRRHGLDRSSSATREAMDRLGKRSEDQLTANEYYALICETGYVSCYDPIPPGEFAIVEI